MSVIVQEDFARKAKELMPSLHHKTILPQRIVNIVSDDAAYQGFRVEQIEAASLPIVLSSGESVILDFGAHSVGYLHFSVNHFGAVKITDSPVMLSFSFGEFPLEIMASKENYHGTLGSGWLQNETKSMVFTPYTGALERRYAFRYLKIERVDTASFPIAIDNLFVDGVSSVSMEEVPPFHIPDKALEQIYKMSLCTLKECSQEVFEDGPKRDRRLWLGDLRLQALSAYVSFKNTALIKRCLYLFAAYRRQDGFVAPCVFPDSPPYIDAKGWHLSDYSLFLTSCLYDYMVYEKDLSLVKELYDTAVLQVRLVCEHMEKDGTLKGSDIFIDWCEGLDKTVAFLGVYLYCLHHLRTIAESLGKDSTWIVDEIKEKKKILLSYRNKDGFFVTKSGQLSWHSQIWSVLSGCLSQEEGLLLLKKTKEENPKVCIHTPYMMHFYIEALYNMGAKEEAMDVIRSFWGELSSVGFDCCPEIFNPENPMESPYNAPEINSACHAWSCTPIYWIYRYYHEIYEEEMKMKDITLVVMAAGMGSRFGGLKQAEPVTPDGKAIIDFSVFDAKKAGFTKVVFIIREDMKEDFIRLVGSRVEKMLPTEYVMQDMTVLPDGRTKPFGTGHAILCCKGTVNEPFAIINADDYYGSNAFMAMAEHLKNAGKGEFAMTAYELFKTLSPNGTVSRGVCSVNDGYLSDVTEITKIDTEGKCEIDGKEQQLASDTPVSMNLWGLTPDIFEELEIEFKEFLATADLMKAEFFIPTVINNMAKKGLATIRVYKNTDQWYGITYREDLPSLKEAIGGYIDAGLYEGM